MEKEGSFCLAVLHPEEKKSILAKQKIKTKSIMKVN